ncbi:hypothetical protein T10_8633 [Trichinella papuae]|uniref:Uncharacterized protein n=1 Tax=Trichinella papuae TaxID=268474 RepID=A0A0V1M8F8_9BILA|nr:hypothetical protein T10_8633 [Trichinella papuae]
MYLTPISMLNRKYYNKKKDAAWLSGSIIDGGYDRLGRIVKSDGISYGKRLDYLLTGPNCLHGRRFGHLRSFAFLRSAFRVAGARPSASAQSLRDFHQRSNGQRLPDSRSAFQTIEEERLTI